MTGDIGVPIQPPLPVDELWYRIFDTQNQHRLRLLYLVLGTDHFYLIMYADIIGQLVLINSGYQSSLICNLSTNIY